MKINSYYVSFLRDHGYLQVYSIGTIRHVKYSPNTMESDPDTGRKRPNRNDLLFFDNPDTAMDERLVFFIQKQTQASLSVVQANIRTYSEMIHELLHQGLEFEIEGVGHFRWDHAGAKVCFKKSESNHGFGKSDKGYSEKGLLSFLETHFKGIFAMGVRHIKKFNK